MSQSVVNKSAETSLNWRLEISNFLAELGSDISKSSYLICKKYSNYYSNYLYPVLCIQTGINIDDVPELLNHVRINLEESMPKIESRINFICV